MPPHHRKESIFNLGSAETKLLYTLHWILLDAMDECCLEEQERGNLDYHNYNVPLSSITVLNPNIRICLFWEVMGLFLGV